MTAISSNRVASVAVAALLYLPAAALAQSSQPPASAVPGGAKPTAAQSSPLAEHPVAGKTAKERVEQRIKELYSQLRITPAERPQWDQFVQVMRENARDMDQAWLQRVDHFQSMNAVQNMELDEQIAEQHAQDVQKLARCVPKPVQRNARPTKTARRPGIPGECWEASANPSCPQRVRGTPLPTRQGRAPPQRGSVF